MLYSVLVDHIATAAAAKVFHHPIAKVTHFAMISPDLRLKLENLVHEVIKSGEIVNIIVSEHGDFDDESRINVKVIYESKSKRLDPKEVAGITTKARKLLLDSDDDRFPVFYFILKSEAGGLIAAE